MRKLFPASGYAQLLYGFLRIAQARSIGKAHGQAVEQAGFFQKISGRTGDVGHKCTLAPQQSVEQT